MQYSRRAGRLRLAAHDILIRSEQASTCEFFFNALTIVPKPCEHLVLFEQSWG